MASLAPLRFAFRPRLWGCLKGYRRADFAADIGAGVTVGLVALPLAMAFGIASGVRPDQGIATAIVGGLIVSLLGGSRVQIAGPAGAFVGLLYAIAVVTSPVYWAFRAVRTGETGRSRGWSPSMVARYGKRSSLTTARASLWT